MIWNYQQVDFPYDIQVALLFPVLWYRYCNYKVVIYSIYDSQSATTAMLRYVLSKYSSNLVMSQLLLTPFVFNRNTLIVILICHCLNGTTLVHSIYCWVTNKVIEEVKMYAG